MGVSGNVTARERDSLEPWEVPEDVGLGRSEVFLNPGMAELFATEKHAKIKDS